MNDVIFIVSNSDYPDDWIKYITTDVDEAKTAADTDHYDIENVIDIARPGCQVYSYDIQKRTLDAPKGLKSGACTLPLSAYLSGAMVHHYKPSGLVKVLATSEEDAMQQINAYLEGGTV